MRAAHDIKRNFAQTRFSAGRHCRVSRKELQRFLGILFQRFGTCLGTVESQK